MAWHLILARDGTVVGVMDGAPASWIGTRLEDCADAPEDLKDAAATFLKGAAHSASFGVPATVPLPSTDETVRLTMIDALPLRRRPTNVSALLHSSLDIMMAQAKAADVSLKIVIDRRMPPTAVVDPDKIAWVVTALVGNALRYVRRGSFMMPSGSITVRATFNSVSPAVTLEVQDDGPGIPADKLRGLFDTRPDGPRLGLGLLMVREIVAAHGGHLEVESQTDAFMSGTVVRLTLPVS
jgi:signal transduction histidine kinase